MTAKGAGRTTRRFRLIAAAQRARRDPCCLCGGLIDYELPSTDLWSYTTAHDKPVKTHPHLAEDPRNIKGAAHRYCNSLEGAGDAPPLSLGVTSQLW